MQRDGDEDEVGTELVEDGEEEEDYHGEEVASTAPQVAVICSRLYK